MKKYFALASCFGLACLLIGCGPEASTQTSETTAPAIDGSKFLLAVEPDGAGDVMQVREQAVDGEDIVIVGRIGGSENPWIAGRAAFSIVDNSLKACSDIEGDNCPIPWDYCCETSKLPAGSALVKVVDENGDLVKANAKDLLDVEELSTVVIQGKAKRDEAGNLSVLASGVFVKKK